MSTWGQLRLLLTKGAPGVDADLIDGWINRRYEQILESDTWEGVKQEAVIMTTAAIESTTTDTVAYTQGSATVTFTGRQPDDSWVGRKLYRPAVMGPYYTFLNVSAPDVTLDREWDGDTTATGDYLIFQDVYGLPEDCRAIVKDSVINPVTGLPMKQLSRQELAAAGASWTAADNPYLYAVHGDSAETDIPILHQIQFAPPPLYRKAIPYEYVRAGLGFDGENTSASPMPWVSDTVLVEGVEADICAHLAKVAAQEGKAGPATVFMGMASAHESKHQAELSRLLRIEHQQRKPQATLQMPDRFTRHRLERAMRTYPKRMG